MYDDITMYSKNHIKSSILVPNEDRHNPHNGYYALNVDRWIHSV